MNYRKFFFGLIAAGALILIAVFVFFGGHDERYRSPYAGYLEQSKLAYHGGLRLRGETVAKGEEKFAAAMKLYAEDRFEPAADLLRQAVAEHPEPAEWWMYLGISHYLLGRPADAVDALERANRNASSELRPHVDWYLANAHLLAGDREPAERLLNSLIDANALHASEARTLLGNLQRDVAD